MTTGISLQVRREVGRQFPVRVKIALPAEGLGQQFEIIRAWLDEACGAESWAVAPARLNGVVNDAIAFYFADAAFARAFLARFCCGFRVETAERAFRIRREGRHLSALADR